MEDNSKKSKRIAKNTATLYVRMLLLMGINLFTTRVVLQALGIEDYGIYNVVGGIVAIFAVLSRSLSSANSRFLNFEMGKGNKERLKAVFSTGVTIQLGLAFLIVFFTEIGGTWFLNNKMVIPTERLMAANWVFQFSVITFCLNLISVPYNAAIIAHEKMKTFAYISIYEGVAKLVIAYLVMVSPWDKLIIYAALMCGIQLSVRSIYTFYCKRHFDECSYKFTYDKDLLKELFSYAGWNFIGAGAVVLRTQGGNILINLFAGPAVNAARGVANQVNHAVTGFSCNFMTAVKPQITKSYAAGDYEYLESLILQSARFSYYLILFLSLPIVINIDFILGVWLNEIPERTTIFVILTFIFALTESFSNPLITAQLATGKVRNYQLVVGSLDLLNIPISYLLLYLGAVPEVFLYVAITLSIICLFVRLFMLHRNIGFNVSKFVKRVLCNCAIVSIISAPIPFLLSNLMKQTWLSLFLLTIVAIICTSTSMLFVGCNVRERSFVFNRINNFRKKAFDNHKY